MLAIPEQESRPSSATALSWGALLERIKDDMVVGPRIIKARDYKTGALRYGPLYNVHERDPGPALVFVLVFVSMELFLATRSEDGQPVLRNIGEGVIEVRITKDASAPSLMSDGEIVFSDGGSDYKVCPRTTDVNVF